ncbi:MAG TPA: hypothetical protein VH540_11890 [Ktedonobacterales bacterium]|jgi:hypothetical protein
MAETLGLRLYEPHLRAHRLIPTSHEGAQPKECLQVADLACREATLAGSDEDHTLLPSQATRALAAQARDITSGAAQCLDGLPALLETIEAPESAQQAVVLLRSILAALPDEFSTGLRAMIAQIDWAFLQMLNQPGQPGLIEQVLAALGAPSEGEEPETSTEAYQAEIEGLRQLHRDLVSLQQEWDTLVEETLPPSPAPPMSAPKADLSGPPVAPALAKGIVLKKRPAPPAASSFASAPPARPEESALRSSAHWLHRARTMRVRFALAVGLFFILLGSGLGVLALKNGRFPVSSPGAATAVVYQPGPPGATATSIPAPTSTRQPIPTSSTPSAPSSQLKSTPIPQPPASPTPAPNFWCPSANQPCVSSLLLAVPCTGQGTATLQLKNNTTRPQSWQAISSKLGSRPLVTMNASNGQLQPGEVVTLTIAAADARQHLGGMLTITNSESKGQTLVWLMVCG